VDSRDGGIHFCLYRCTFAIFFGIESIFDEGESEHFEISEILSSSRPETIVFDGGGEFNARGVFEELDRLGIGYGVLPPNDPNSRGLIERFIGTLKYEWLMWREIMDIGELNRNLEDFRVWYNSRRVHMSLGYRIPEEFYRREDGRFINQRQVAFL
jgi:transposase InsO family protein